MPTSESFSAPTSPEAEQTVERRFALPSAPVKKNWRHHYVTAAGFCALGLLVALTWTSVGRGPSRAAVRDGFLVLRHANGEPVEGSRVVALRDDGVRWARDTDAAGVVGFKRGGGKIEVVVRVPEGWFYRTVVDLNDAFVDVDLPRQPGRTDRLDDLSVEVRAAFD